MKLFLQNAKLLQLSNNIDLIQATSGQTIYTDKLRQTDLLAGNWLVSSKITIIIIDNFLPNIGWT